MNEYVVSVDIAKKRDYTAVMIFRDNITLVEGIEALGQQHRFMHFYDVIHIDKFQGLTYPEIADTISRIMEHSDLKGNSDLLVDGTGVGEAAVDLMRERFLNPIPIVFTGGGTPREVYADMGTVFATEGRLRGARVLKEIHVPKASMVASARILAQQKRVRLAEGLKWAEEYERQMHKFHGKVNDKTGNRKYEAETEDAHDDLVVCLLMASWWLNRERKDAEQGIGTGELPDWNPMEFA